ncbi:MAG: hypothetical protein KDB22_23015 [Planctomycetales bacterium]|nr:hypothetical protein [Planctomycetales bacterium]
MTLLSRRKHRIIARSTIRRETPTEILPGQGSHSPARKILTRWLAATLCGASSLATASAFAQQPQWSPTRIPASAAQPLATAAMPVPAGQLQSASTVAAYSAGLSSDRQSATVEPAASSVVLRWKHSNRVARSEENLLPSPQQAFAESPSAGQRRSIVAEAYERNPLRAVQPAAYQQEALPLNPFGDDPSPSLPNIVPNTQDPRNLENLLPDLPADPLSQPELPPAPEGMQFSQPEDASPFDRQFERTEPEQIAAPEEEEDVPELPRRDSSRADSISCDELREQVRARPLTSVSLNVSPPFGKSSRTGDVDLEKQRREFAESAKPRSWSNYKGEYVASGRFVELRDNKVFIDVAGNTITIPYLDLSDEDVAYVSEAWNIPGVCGTGYERLVGRNFLESQVQWTASGLCHKPAYFEAPQLERYGHEVGPVLQPLLSSAHFFGNIAILPYKMGIHPPNECQYSLGYLRPGNCAPYMIQPFPWSLRGAAVQAGVVTGAAALVP